MTKCKLQVASEPALAYCVVCVCVFELSAMWSFLLLDESIYDEWLVIQFGRINSAELADLSRS